MLNRSASLAMSTNVLKALPGKFDTKRRSLSILYLSRRCGGGEGGNGNVGKRRKNDLECCGRIEVGSDELGCGRVGGGVGDCVYCGRGELIQLVCDVVKVVDEV